ncbi:MAG TPA: GDSL-type esterase/lipase family protein [Candidatus Saccharimonadales bacterium]|jgi:lysophospholipase L1-like esterase|nr:GDSL-type esterase/lipase family protein [Candidatus Saccharimonadales bacterium]
MKPDIGLKNKVLFGITFLIFLVAVATLAFTKLVPKKTLLPVKAPAVFNIVFDSTLTHSNLYAPSGVKVDSVSPDKIQISWNFDNDKLMVPTGNAPEYAILSGFRIYRDGFWYEDVPKSNMAFVDDSLYPGSSYSYSVSALTFDYKIEGNKSASVSAATLLANPNPVVFPIKNGNINSYMAEGDSITEGLNLPNKGWTYADLLTDYLNAHGNKTKLFNYAVSISTSLDVNNRFPAEIRSADPDLVTVAIGVNDMTGYSRDIGNVSMSEYRDHLRNIVKTAEQERPRDIALLNIFYINVPSDKRVVWDKVVRDVANQFGVLYIDVSTPVIQNGGNSLLAGVLHPTQQGHTIVARAVINSISGLLSR